MRIDGWKTVIHNSFVPLTCLSSQMRWARCRHCLFYTETFSYQILTTWILYLDSLDLSYKQKTWLKSTATNSKEDESFLKTAKLKLLLSKFTIFNLKGKCKKNYIFLL